MTYPTYTTDPQQLRSIAMAIGNQENQETPQPPDVTPVASRTVAAELASVAGELRSAFEGLCSQFGMLRARIADAAERYQAADDAAASRGADVLD